jgi:hypothetical protein
MGHGRHHRQVDHNRVASDGLSSSDSGGGGEEEDGDDPVVLGEKRYLSVGTTSSTTGRGDEFGSLLRIVPPTKTLPSSSSAVMTSFPFKSKTFSPLVVSTIAMMIPGQFEDANEHPTIDDDFITTANHDDIE